MERNFWKPSDLPEGYYIIKIFFNNNKYRHQRIYIAK
jgi:hypothetical protein